MYVALIDEEVCAYKDQLLAIHLDYSNNIIVFGRRDQPSCAYKDC